ncbi:MAG: glutamate-5-semialdehyde dehydrogenase [Lachnospira sp.]|nr:glutamate-5-semialdehyde dehydrogenase [Lachnospira sp.]
MMDSIKVIGQRAKEASKQMSKLEIVAKNNALVKVGDAISLAREEIKQANQKDILIAKENGMKPALLDRLTLTDARIDGMVEGLLQLVQLEDPVGEIKSMKTRPNGLMIGYKKVPLGVVAIIYESRPNVTVDAFGLTFKSGNAVVLRGGSDSINSNKKLVEIIRKSLEESNINPDAVILVTETDRKYVDELMKLNQYIDVIIPRGGYGLIQNVVQNATVPVIETGTGNCHIYVDKSANLEMAKDIIYNAKTQRIGVCNACESLVIHRVIADKAIPIIVDKLKEKNVEIRGDKTACEIDSRIVEASSADWGTEYLDYILSLKVVDSIEEAIHHINTYNTGHSEAIITNDYDMARKFTDEIDAAAVYVNASTRFTDGFEFGFGAEIGISTQKMHARGPMGLAALTTGKYIVLGNGQIRD